MQSESISKAMKDFADADFRARIRASNPAHDRASFFFVKNVHSRRSERRANQAVHEPYS
jgi:hypothetical protein